MSFKPDRWIKEEVAKTGMITNFVDHQVKERDGKPIVSYGLSSYGYDVRASRAFDLMLNLKGASDPHDKNTSEKFDHSNVKFFFVKANSLARVDTIERVKVPDKTNLLVHGKSTYARCGLIVNVAPVEAGFIGHLTLTLLNPTPLPIKVYIDEGIAQIQYYGD